MLPLRELQLRFATAIFEGVNEPIAPYIRDDGIDSGARLKIYANNLREGFTKTLALEFPVIQKLVGEDYFRQLALAFLASHPSRAGNLLHIGAPFAGFLGRRFARTEYAYMADVAELEWAYQEAMVAAEEPPLDLDDLRAINPADYGELCFDLHPACRLIESRFPIVRIWSANQPGSSSDGLIDLNSGGDSVLVCRPSDCVQFQRLSAGQFELLKALAAAQTLGTALEVAQKADSSFDLGAALARYLALGLLTCVCLASTDSSSKEA